MNKLTLALVASLLSVFAIGAFADGKSDKVALSLDATMTSGKIYEGQIIAYEQVLYSNTRNIQQIGDIKRLQFDNLSLIYDSRGSSRYHINPVESKDKNKRYAVAIKEVYLKAGKPGNASISPGQCTVAVATQSQSADPFFDFFWGRASESYQVSAKALNFKVHSLPKAPADFSGAVGVFTIESRLPDAVIDKGGEMSVAYVISGDGDLRDIAAPDFMSLFPNGLRLKSVEPSEEFYLDNGKLKCMVIYDCLFSATEYGTFTIPELSFTFFNPEEGKYNTIKSSPRKVKVSSDNKNSEHNSRSIYVKSDEAETTNCLITGQL